jgi:hypothetical protein
MSMTNNELQDAITMANAMVKAAAQDSRTYAPLLAHLNALLKLQQQRAEQVPQWPTQPAPMPTWVQPMIVQPMWVPPAPWTPPFTVTC